MDASRLAHIDNVLKHVYISPLEQCNLCCKMCYTTKTKEILDNDHIQDFLLRYRQFVNLQTVTFCGGEVFLLPTFPQLVNALTQEGIFIQIITNGSIDHLDEIQQPNLVNLIVSLDGLPEYHDHNRGRGMWQQSVAFMKKALNLGFHAEVFSIVTEENSHDLVAFESLLTTILNSSVSITYHPRKPLTYLTKHPTSNRVGEVAGFSFPSQHTIADVSQQYLLFPPSNLGCYQISVMSNGQVYGCCEGIHPIGTISDDIGTLLNNFKARITEWERTHPHSHTLGCVEPGFICGLESN